MPQEKLCGAERTYASQFDYEIRAEEITPEGILVDRSGQDYPPLADIDRLVGDVETCLEEKYGSPPALPPEIMQAYDCPDPTFPFPFDRSCLTIKIPNDWMVTRDGKQEILPYAGPSAGCRQKNPEHQPENGCFWRAGLQCSSTVVSTPSLFLFKDPLLRLMTGCNNPWGVHIYEDGSWHDLAADLPPELRLSECASPGASGVPSRSPLPAQPRPEGFLGRQVDTAQTGCGY